MQPLVVDVLIPPALKDIKADMHTKIEVAHATGINEDTTRNVHTTVRMMPERVTILSIRKINTDVDLYSYNEVSQDA